MGLTVGLAATGVIHRRYPVLRPAGTIGVASLVATYPTFLLAAYGANRAAETFEKKIHPDIGFVDESQREEMEVRSLEPEPSIISLERLGLGC